MLALRSESGGCVQATSPPVPVDLAIRLPPPPVASQNLRMGYCNVEENQSLRTPQ